MAAFYADAMPTACRLSWAGAAELEAFGTEADMVAAGVRREGVADLLEAMRDGLPVLNSIRREVMEETLAPPRQAELYASPGGGLTHG
jgi:hypothetical protein